MIKYTLKCGDGHQFESWFQSSDAYTKLIKAGQLNCAVCGSDKIEKSLMSPRVNVPAKGEDAAPSLRKPMSEMEAAVQKFREHVEANSEDVGEKFVDEVRAMHYGDAPERSVIGEAKTSDAKELISEGIPVAPLPWTSPKNKANN